MQTRTDSRPTITSLLVGILDDLRLLLRQEVQLAKHEITAELTKAKRAAVSTAVGMALLAVGGLMLLLMLVHGLQALTGLPLWACYGIVGGGLAVIGGGLAASGRRRAGEVDFVPRATVATLKENATWMKEQAKSVRM